MIATAEYWLREVDGPRGPTRGKWAGEGHMRPGDVTDTGDLVVRDCVTMASGVKVVTVDQAAAAAYYGWMSSGLKIYRGDQVLVQIFRGL